jgi:GAF domain-containing protein
MALWLASPDGSGRLAAEVGYPAEVARAVETIRGDLSTPVGAALREGATAWVSSRAQLDARWPGATVSGWYSGEFAVAALPLETRTGRIGAVAITFSGARAFPTEDRAMLVAIARQGSQALERARLLDAERRARADAEAEHQRTAFLYEASVLLSSSLDWEDTLAAVARMAVPRIADWCAVDLAEDVEHRRASAVVAHADPAKVALAQELGRRFPPDPDAPHGIGNVLRTGDAELYEEISEELLARMAQ